MADDFVNFRGAMTLPDDTQVDLVNHSLSDLAASLASGAESCIGDLRLEKLPLGEIGGEKDIVSPTGRIGDLRVEHLPLGPIGGEKDIVSPTGRIGDLRPRTNCLSDWVVQGEGKTLNDVMANPQTTWLERVDTKIVDSSEALNHMRNSGR